MVTIQPYSVHVLKPEDLDFGIPKTPRRRSVQGTFDVVDGWTDGPAETIHDPQARIE